MMGVLNALGELNVNVVGVLGVLNAGGECQKVPREYFEAKMTVRLRDMNWGSDLKCSMKGHQDQARDLGPV